MNIKINLKNCLIFLSILFLIFYFPLQVIFYNPYFSLLPYLPLIILFFVPNKRDDFIYKKNFNIIDLCLCIYFFFVVINNIIQLLSNLITLYDAISSIIYYCSPLIYYIYFSYRANIIQFKISLKAIIFGGLASASYYVYDTFYRLIFLMYRNIL